MEYLDVSVIVSVADKKKCIITEHEILTEVCNSFNQFPVLKGHKSNILHCK